MIVVASLNDVPFTNGYLIQKDLLAIPNAGWKEILNSDGAIMAVRTSGIAARS